MRRALVVLLVACGTDGLPGASLALSVGQEAGAWERAPAAVRVAAASVSGGQRASLGEGAWPAESLDLAPLTPGQRVSFRVEFRDASGKIVVAGATPEALTDVLSGGEIPVHCGRVGEFSRPTAGLAAGWARPAAALALGQYLFVSGEAADTPATTADELYDLLLLASLPATRPLPRVPRSALATASGRVLLVNEAGATLIDLTDGTSADVAVEGAGEAAGGVAVAAADGASFLVGAGRLGGAPTSVVLRLGADGVVSRLDLGSARLGAAAAWVPSIGLVVAGGAADAPAEALAAGASSFVALAASVRATEGAVLAPLGDADAVLLGGSSPQGEPRGALRLRLSCGAGCLPAEELGSVAELRGGSGHALAAGRALVVGESKGATGAFLVSALGDTVTVEAAPLRTARRDAVSVALGDGRVAVLGGLDASGAAVRDVEVFTP